MGKKIIFLSLLLFCLGTAKINAQQYLTNLQQQATQMLDATLKKDYATLVKYMHPNLVRGLGGPAKSLSTIKTGMESLKSQGAELNKAVIGKVGQCITGKTNIQCILPQIMDIKMSGSTIHTVSHLLCISYNGGKNWYFLDAGNADLTKLKQLVPEMNSKLIIPKSQTSFN